MGNNTSGAVGGSRTHPIIIVAAVAVLAFAVVGTAAFLGWLPMARSFGTSPGSMASPGQQPAGGVASEYPVVQEAEPEAAPAVKPAPAAKPAPVARPAPAGKPAPAVKPAPPARPAPVAAKPAPSPAAPVAAAPPRPQPTTPDYRQATQVAANAPPPEVRKTCNNCGTVTSVTAIEKQGQASGAGAVVGGVLGGVLGHQVGSGRGNDAATVVGALGGAYAGNQIEKNRNRSVTWEVRVRLDDGSSKVVRYQSQPAFRAGDKVKVENNLLVRG